LILVCTLFPIMQGCYLCPKNNPTPIELRHCLLASKGKQTLLKIEKDSRRSQTLQKLTLTHCQSWIDPPPSCLVLGVFSCFPPFSFHRSIPSWPSANHFDPHAPSWAALTIDELLLTTLFSLQSVDCVAFSSTTLPYPF
jgi:hypothetical protein